jgi:CheY-like chemotaxis protein/HPt (histidine-containing phosphotransfer) domain-containing protein
MITHKADRPDAANLVSEKGKLSGIRVLLVDECLITREMVIEQLAHEEMRVDTFASCAESLVALKMAAATDDVYRIALFDAQTSDCDPFSLGAAVKADLALSDTFLMLLNSELQGLELMKLADAGFSAVLKMPTSRQCLIESLNTLCAAISDGEPPPFLNDAQSTKVPMNSFDASLQLNGFSILVVDDDVVNQAVVVQMLEKFGCHVETANDGVQAVIMHSTHHFHLILMDCQMPELDGYQATARIRANEAAIGAPRVPIVALTAHVLAEEREKCLASGMDDFISKPIRPVKLLEVLSHWLRMTNVANVVVEESIPEDDMEAMKELFGDDFAELAFLFQSDSLKRIAGMHVAVARADYAELIRLVHAFNGSASSMGASNLAFLCKNFEAQLKAGMFADIEGKVISIEVGYATVEARLQSMLGAAETR